MAKIVKTLTVSWQWSGDKYSLRGFNLAVTPAAKNPKEEVVATAFVETKEIKQTYSYKMGNVTLDKDAQYKIWVQAVYENSDSDWVATGGATVTDDGSATIITKTDREIQDVVNMASDNILTRQEKVSLRREWQEIVYEFLEIESTAAAQGIPSSNAVLGNFKSKGNALGTYLNGGSAWTISSSNKTSFPLWINDSNLGSNTSINGNTYRETFRVYCEAKVKILEEINKYKVNNVQVGGVNLLVGTATAKNTNVNVPTSYVAWDPYTTHNKQTLEQLGFKVGDKITVGFDWSISKNGTNDYVYGNFRVEFRGIKSDGTDNQYLGVIKNPAGTFSSSNTKGRVEATVALDSATIKAHSLRFRIDNSVLNFKVSNLKMERGTKATGWSPALEEMENAYTIILTNEAQVIPTNSNRVPTSSATYFTDIQVYKGTAQRNDYTIGTVNSANGITVSKTSSRVNFAVSTNTTLAADGGNFIIPITIDGKTFNKTFSWSCSKQGNTGATGNAGQDAITIVLSNENHTFPCESNGNIPTALSTTCVVTAYKGGTSVAPAIGTITNPRGMTITKNGATLTIQANTGTSLADSGTVNIPISVDGKTFNKTFTWSKAKKGATGATGATGAGAKTVDIIASSQVFKSTDGGLTFSPTTIKLTPKLQNVTYSNWQYSTNGGSSWTNVVSGEKGLSIDSSNKVLTVSKDSSLFTSTVTSVAFRLNTNDSSIYDTMTIVKLYDIADLEIGGRNYLQNSNFANGLDKWAVHDMSNSTGTNKSVSTIKGGSWADSNINTLQIKGTNVTGRYGVRSSDITLVANTTYTISGYCAGHRVRKIQVNVRDKQSSDANIHTVEYNPVNGGNSLSKYYKFETTFTTTSNTLFALNLYAVDLANDGYTWFANIKLEKGNKASDWTPAPEDVATDIDNAKNEAIDSANNTLTTTISNYYTKEQTNSQIDVAKEAINLGVSSTYETKANVETKVSSTLNSAKSYADTKKTEAINSANSTLNTTIANYYTKTQTDSQIKIAKDAIDLSVKNTYETKTEVSNKINNIQVGGRNLMLKTDINKFGIGLWVNNGGTGVVEGTYVDGTKTIKVTGNSGIYYNRYIRLKRDTIYTYSMMIKPSAAINVGSLSPLHMWLSTSESSAHLETVISSSGTAPANIWTKVWITFKTPNTQDTYYMRPFLYEIGSRTVYMTQPQVEEGNKASSWMSALEDTQTSIDTAKSEAITSANNTLNSTIANYYTKAQTDSQINVAKNAITSSVSSTYETKTNVQNKIDAITIGGRNLAQKTSSSYSNPYSSFTGVTNTCPGLGKVLTDGLNVGDKVTVRLIYKYTNIVAASGRTAQCWIQGDGNTTDWSSGAFYGSPRKTISGSGQHEFLYTFTVTTDHLKNSHWNTNVRHDYVQSGSVQWKMFKVEKGTKPTDWSPAPEDMETTVSNLTQRVSTAESKITDTAITNVVRQNFYTKAETNDQITSKGYQTASQVQQTVNNLQLKFTQSGGYNLFSNSGFKKGTSYWGTHAHNSPAGGSIGITTSTGEWGFPDASVNCVHIRLSNQSGIEYGISQTVKTTIGKKYTISFYYAGHRLNSANLIVRNSNSSWLASKTITSFPSGGNGNANNWSKHTLTFTANATSHNINIVIVSAGENGYMWVAKPQVVEGELDLPYSPNPNEMYDGIIEMNRDGIKVSTSNGGWTDFTSAGMNVYNKAGNLSLGTRNGGLTYHNKKGYIGFTSESVVNAYDAAGVTISTANNGSYITLGTSTTTDPFGGFTSTPALSIAKADIGDANTSFYHQGVNLHTTLNVNTKPIKQVGTMYYGINGTTRTYESTTGNLCLLGDNGVVLGYYQGNDIVTKFKIIEGSSASESYIDTYAHWRFHGWSLTDVANLSIKNNIKMETTATIQFNSTATYPSLIWEASNRLKLYGNDGIDFGYRKGSSNMPIFKLHEGDDTAYRIESFSHWNFNNWNLENVGILKPQRLQLPSTYGSNWIGLGTGDGNDYTTYNVKFRTHNGLAFTDNSDSATVIVQGRQGRIMGKNAYYVNCSRSLKSDIRSVISEDDVTTFVAKEGESLDTNISAETVCDFLDAIGVKTYVTDFKQEGATQECFDIEKGNSLTLGYVADDIADHPMFKYVGEKTNDGLYAINSNSLTTTLIVGYQQEKRKREQLEERLARLEQLLKGDE